jgi:hypothetical protein
MTRFAWVGLRIALALLVSASAFGQLSIVPRVVTNRSPGFAIHWSITGPWYAAPLLHIDGNTIIIEVEEWPCFLLSPCVSAGEMNVAMLPAGDYDVVLRDTHGNTILSRTLAILDITTLPIIPAGRPISDEAMSFGALPRNFPDMRLEFGSEKLPGAIDGGHVVAPPSNHEELLDVAYDAGPRGSGIARNAFTYANDACRDERIWERVLVPIDSNAAGAYGSRWVTDVSIVGPERVPGLGPGRDCEFGATIGAPGTHPSGVYVRIPRTASHLVEVRVRVRETSRDGLPIEIPVVRDDEWLTGVSEIEMPKLREGQRAMLRVYMKEDDGAVLQVDKFSLRLAAADRDTPRFASMDVSSMSGTIRLSPSNGAWSIGASEYWAMITITDNVTQQFVVYPAVAKGAL